MRAEFAKWLEDETRKLQAAMPPGSSVTLTIPCNGHAEGCGNPDCRLPLKVVGTDEGTHSYAHAAGDMTP